MKIVKIPLAALLDILTDLYDNGADYIDIQGEENAEGLELKDMMKIIVKPEYLSVDERDEHSIEDEDDDEEDIYEDADLDKDETLEIEIDYSTIKRLPASDNDSKLSDDDLNDLI